MKTSKRMYWIMSALPGAALASALVVTTANAQVPTAKTPMTASAMNAGTPTADATLTNAQLQEEIVELRTQIAQLQREQKDSSGDTNSPGGAMSSDKQGNKKCKEGMKMGTASDGQKGCMSMGDGKSMKSDGMGMMEKHDSMGMPGAGDKPKDPPMKDE